MEASAAGAAVSAAVVGGDVADAAAIGTVETGAIAALPIWMDVMNASIAARTGKDTSPEFEAPGNIVYLTVDRRTGSVMPADSAGGLSEAFISGTQPGAEAFRP